MFWEGLEFRRQGIPLGKGAKNFRLDHFLRCMKIISLCFPGFIDTCLFEFRAFGRVSKDFLSVKGGKNCMTISISFWSTCPQLLSDVSKLDSLGNLI